MSYKLSTKSDRIEVSLVKDELVTRVVAPEYSVSLARTGGQGTKGDSITAAYINDDNELVIELTNSSDVVTIVNAGSLTDSIHLGQLFDVSITAVEDGDYIAYDVATQTYKNHKLTTSKLTDVDNTNKADGAVLVYNGTTSKYTATNTLNNPNTIIAGGYF